MIGDTAPPLSVVVMAMPDLYVHTHRLCRALQSGSESSLPPLRVSCDASDDWWRARVACDLPPSLRESGCEKQIKVSNRWINDSLQKRPALYLLRLLRDPSWTRARWIHRKTEMFSPLFTASWMMREFPDRTETQVGIRKHRLSRVSLKSES